MDSKKRLLLIILVLIMLMAGAYILYNTMSSNYAAQQISVNNQEHEEKTTESGNAMVPDFKILDVDGNERQFHSFLGKPIVLNFWASWCGPCQMEMPDFEQAYINYGDEVNFVMVNVTDGSRETKEIAEEFIAQKGYTFPVFYDTAQEAAYAYAVYSLPTTYFIDAEGNAVAWAKGAINADALQEGLNAIMK